MVGIKAWTKSQFTHATPMVAGEMVFYLQRTLDLHPGQSSQTPGKSTWSVVYRRGKGFSFFKYLPKFLRGGGLFNDMGDDESAPCHFRATIFVLGAQPPIMPYAERDPRNS